MTKSAFKIPEIDEVRVHIQAKRPEWPGEFCKYYAEKFWNFYQSIGWRVSGKAPMKDWKAAFSSQWSNLKYREDMDMLQKLMPRPKQENYLKDEYKPQKVENPGLMSFMDEVLAEYTKHPTLVPNERLAGCYDWMKANKLMRLNKEQREAAISIGNDDICRGKAIAVGFMFDHMISNFITFKDLLHVNVKDGVH